MPNSRRRRWAWRQGLGITSWLRVDLGAILGSRGADKTRPNDLQHLLQVPRTLSDGAHHADSPLRLPLGHLVGHMRPLRDRESSQFRARACRGCDLWRQSRARTPGGSRTRCSSHERTRPGWRARRTPSAAFERPSYPWLYRRRRIDQSLHAVCDTGCGRTNSANLHRSQ